MSAVIDIRAAFETVLNAMSPALATAWENVPFTPVAGTPYQSVTMLLAQPENPTFGDGFYRERGYFQINLCYPSQSGTAAVLARAQLLRDTFPRGKWLHSNGAELTIDKTPEIAPGHIDGDRYVVPVRINFYANITGTDILLTEQGGYLLI